MSAGPKHSTPLDAPVPSRIDAAVWTGKVAIHRIVRGLADRRPGAPRRHARGGTLVGAPVLAESRSALWSGQHGPEWILEAGKVHNLRTAIRHVHGAEFTRGQVFSFWAQLGAPIKTRGFVEGREVRQGCVVPSVAGGICQLSNALYDVALRAGMTILERHGHSMIIAGSVAATTGRDATVMWNYIDLRFSARHAFRIEAELTADDLVVRCLGFAGRRPTRRSLSRVLPVADRRPSAGRSCLACGKTACFRNRPTSNPLGSHRAWLVDAWWPEHDAWIRQHRQPEDRLLLPLDGGRLDRARYAWTTEGFSRVQACLLQTLHRAWDSRKLAAQGAARQRALLAHDERLARAMASRLDPAATRLTVMQNLLPHLWRMGVLGGRRFDVLMIRPPMWALHGQLEQARRLHPQSKTLGDFRADHRLVQAERQALAAAERLVTPHAGLEAQLGTQAVRVPWSVPQGLRADGRATEGSGPRVYFPAATLGRKGAYELRAALRGLDLGYMLLVRGVELEGPDFWDGPVRKVGAAGLEQADLVVLPAHVEPAPRTLLRAVAQGLPVIATDACGLHGLPGVTTVPVGNVLALRRALLRQLKAMGSHQAGPTDDVLPDCSPSVARLCNPVEAGKLF